MASAVGVAVAEGDGAGAVEAEVGGAVHEDGDDGVAADVGDDVRRGPDDVHETRHGGPVVGRHVGDDVRHHDVEGEGPVVGVAGAVGVRIAVNDVALASVEAGAVDGDCARCEGVAAGVGDGGQGDAVGRDVGQAVDGGLAAGCGDGEVHGDDVVGVEPGVVGVIDRVGEGIDGVAASAVADKRRSGEGERDHAVADRHGRGCGREDVGGAVDGGVGIGHGSERRRDDGIDELPRVAVAGAVGVGVAVGDGAVSVGGDVHGRVACIGGGGHIASAGVGERCGRGFDGIACAGHGCRAVSGDGQGRQLDDVGVGPVV